MTRFCAAILTVSLLSGAALAPAWGAECFASSKLYRVHPVHGGADARDGWQVRGDNFAQCVHRGEAAEKTLRAHYPDSLYQLLPASTIGCHSPC